MRILKLIANNVMRLTAVEIDPNGNVQVVAGKNGAGKTSLLNAIYLALAGGAASRDIAKPIRAGEEWAEVQAHIGDETVNLIVTRTWDETGTKLTVKAADGATYKSPQTLLDSLLGSLTFDPLEFTRQKPSAQRQSLLDLLGLDFTAADRERERLYDERLDIGRQAHAFGDLPKLPKDAPMVEVSAVDVVNKIQAANRVEQQRSALEHQQQERRARIDLIGRQVIELRERIAGLEAEAAGHSTAIVSLASEVAELPAPADTEALSAELATIEERNKTARDNQRIAAGRERQKALQVQYTELTHAIDAIDASKAAALAAVEMPVPGLGFDDQGVTFGGVPFGQASSAEQIRVSFSMAISMNPALRLVLIPDGSLLDSDSMAEIRAAAAENDVQVFVEMVGDGGDDPTAIVIVDGEVVKR